MFNSLWPHGLQHARLPCPSLSPEFAQTHVHWVSEAIQPSHPLSPTSSFALSLSPYQGLFQWVNSLHQVFEVLELQLQHQSFQWIFRTKFPLGLTGLIFLLSKGLSRVLQQHCSKALILWCSAFFMVQLSHAYQTTGNTGETIALTLWTFVGKVMSLFFNMLSRFVIAFHRSIYILYIVVCIC